MEKKTICPYDCPAGCSLVAEVEDGRITCMRGDGANPATKGITCSKIRRYPESLYSEKRLLYPMKRVGEKGSGEFERISWDEAVRTIAEELQRVIGDYGAESVLPCVSSGIMSKLQRFGGHAFFGWLGASQLAMTLCCSAKDEGYAQVMGSTPALSMQELVDSDFYILWGCNVAATRIHAAATLVKARREGKRVVLIDTYETAAAKYADEVLLVRPGTDGALVLSMLHVLWKEELIDRAFLEEKTEGWQDMVPEIESFTPERGEEITGVPAEVIRALAREYGRAQAPAILLGSGIARHRNGAMMVRLITILPAFVGAWRRPGGGLCGCGVAAGKIFREDLIRRPDLRKGAARTININQLASALDPQCTTPPVKALYVYNTNPANTVSNQKKLLEGLAREDLFTVVHERFLTDTARYADILLPAAFSVEQSDVYLPYGFFSAGYGKKIVEPAGEAKSNWSVFCLLASAMGCEEEVFTKSEEEIIEQLLEKPGSYLAQHPEELAEIRSGGSVLFCCGLREEFQTESGRIQIVNRMLERPVPGYVAVEPDPYPLRLVIGPAMETVNSTFLESEYLLQKRGAMRLLIHPADARERGITAGSRVICFNELAEVEFEACVTDKTKEGTVVTEGVYDRAHSFNGLTSNALYRERLTDYGESTTMNDNGVDVRRC